MKSLKIAAVVLTAGCALVACGTDKSNEPAETMPQSSEPAGKAASQQVQYDTGDYFPKYRVPYRDMTSLEGGKAIESNVIADVHLLGYEFNPVLKDGRRSANVYTHNGFGEFLLSNYMSTLEEMNPPIQGGHYLVSQSQDKETEFLSTIVRLDSAKSAQKMANKLYELSVTQGPQLSDHKEIAKNPKKLDREKIAEDVPVKEVPNTRASKAKSRNLEKSTDSTAMETFTTHNEFMIYTRGNGNPKAFGKTRAQAIAFLKKQVPLLDSIPTHKTAAGYGKLKNWAPTDKHGLLRYAVTTPVGAPAPQDVGTHSARAYAGTHMRPDGNMKILELSGIEHVASWETTIGKASGEDSAKTYQNAYISKAVDTQDFEKYDEPQQLPNTKCMKQDSSSGGGVECVMVYGDMIAKGVQGYSLPLNQDSSETSATKSDSEHKDQAKYAPESLEAAQKLLSQKMAAQYKIFEDAKKNPKGSVPPSLQSVKPR